MDRHGLSPLETAQVESAVLWGKELEDERLRRAAVDWAQRLLAGQRSRRRIRGPARRRVAVGLLIVGVGGLLVLVAPEGVPWHLLVVWAVLLPVTHRLGNGPERAIRLNRGDASD